MPQASPQPITTEVKRAGVGQRFCIRTRILTPFLPPTLPLPPPSLPPTAVWQVKSGTVFDDIIVTDSLAEAQAFAAETFDKKAPKEKAAFEAAEKKKADEAEAERKAREEAAKAAEAAKPAAADADEEDEEDDEDEL